MISFLLPPSIYASPDFEYTQVIKREYPVAATGVVKVQNKFGRIEVSNWDQNKVKIDIRIIVQAPNERSASYTFDRIDIGFFNNEHTVKAFTEIATSKNSWSYRDYNTPVEEEFSINYKVFMPFGFNLELDVQYGDIYLGEIKQKTDMILRHCNIEILNLNDDSRLDCKFVRGNIYKINKAELKLENAELQVGEAKDLILTSNNSTIKIDKAEALRFHSKLCEYIINEARLIKNNGQLDKLNIGSADQVVMNAKESRLTLEKLRQNLSLDLHGGIANIKYVAKDLEKMVLVGNNAKFIVNLAEDVAYELDATAHFAGINYPENMEVFYEHKDSDDHIIKGQSRSASYNYRNSIIKARLVKGGIKVEQK